MIIYNDYEPKSIKLRAITPNGKEISVNAFLSPSEEKIIVDSGYNNKDAKYQFSTHIRCSMCGKICDKHQVYYKDSLYFCYECNKSIEYKKYIDLPVKDFNYPFFINDKIIFEEDDLFNYIEDNNIKDFSKEYVHPAIKIESEFDLQNHIQDYIDNRIAPEDYDINISDCSSIEFEELVNMEKRINDIIKNIVGDFYEEDLKHRLIIPEFSSQ